MDNKKMVKATKKTVIKGKYLPVGTVVLLENGKKKLMITGFAVINPKEEKKVWDYCGCLYPEGIVKANEIFLFDHKQIKKVYHLGLKDDKEEKQFKMYLKKQLQEKK